MTASIISPRRRLIKKRRARQAASTRTSTSKKRMTERQPKMPSLVQRPLRRPLLPRPLLPPPRLRRRPWLRSRLLRRQNSRERRKRLLLPLPLR